MTTELENQPVTVESLAENLLHFELRGLQPDAWLADYKTSEIRLAIDWARHWIMQNPTNQKGGKFEWQNIADLLDITADIDSGKITMTNGLAAVLLHDVEKLKIGALPNCAA
ncbi:hypothetical protein [Limnohabitans sp.]